MPGEGAAGVSPAPFEQGKPGRRGRPGVTPPTSGPREGLSPAPFEQGKPGRRGGPGLTPPTAGPREGLSPAPFERGRGRGKPVEQSPGPAGSIESNRAVTTPPPSAGGPPSPERGRAQGRRPGGQPQPGQGESGPNQPQGREQRMRFGTPAPMGTGEREPRGAGRPSGFNQPVSPQTGAAAAEEGRIQRERAQGVHAPPPQQQQQQGGAPAGVGRGQPQGQGQPEGGKRKPEKGTPPPGPR